MANYCSNSVTYYSDNQGQILNLYLRLRSAAEALGDMEMGSIKAKPLLAELGVDPEIIEKLDGRTSINYLGLLVEDEKPVGVQFDAESAWSPCDDFADILLRAIYPDRGDIEMVYTAEEPGCEVYVNTDVDHRFYKTVLVMNVIAGKINDSYYYNMDELDSAFDMIKKLTGYRPSKLADLDDPKFMEKLEAGFRKKYPDEDDYLGIYTYENS